MFLKIVHKPIPLTFSKNELTGLLAGVLKQLLINHFIKILTSLLWKI